jgi:hypothetical protein
MLRGCFAIGQTRRCARRAEPQVLATAALRFLMAFMADSPSGFSFLPPCCPSYRALAFALVRLSSLNTPAFLGHTNMPVYPGALRAADHSEVDAIL